MLTEEGETELRDNGGFQQDAQHQELEHEEPEQERDDCVVVELGQGGGGHESHNTTHTTSDA